MGDFNYTMMDRGGKPVGTHSITFGDMNTWDTWHMAPKSRPFVSAPQVKTEYIDVPGADGSLDYTEVLTGKPRYANRTGQWDFILDNGYAEWHAAYTDILMKLHGKYFERIILEDDPEYYWSGRLTVVGGFGNKDYNSVSIQYNLYPYKTPIETEYISNWLWNDLFTNTIYYGTFTVSDKKFHNVLNDNENSVIATITCTNRMKVYKLVDKTSFWDIIVESEEKANPYIELYAGDNEIELQPGNNYLAFVGDGYVTVVYERGKRL